MGVLWSLSRCFPSDCVLPPHIQVELEWQIAPGEGHPDLVSATPGGSVFLEHRNLEGEGRQLYGSVSTSNFFAPQVRQIKATLSPTAHL